LRDPFFVTTLIGVRITYDPSKRQKTLIERGLDFARADEVFGGRHFSSNDLRQDYLELRKVTVGLPDGRMVIIVWTPRGASERRIISMRKANEREKAKYRHYLD
jgi:uncharacterized DUF497 family protein